MSVKSCFDDIKRDLPHAKTVIEKVKIFERLLGFRQCKRSLRLCPASSHPPEEKPNQYTHTTSSERSIEEKKKEISNNRNTITWMMKPMLLL